jgi:hypothetical protein
MRGKASVFVLCNYEKYKARIVRKKVSESNQGMLYGLLMSFSMVSNISRHLRYTSVHVKFVDISEFSFMCIFFNFSYLPTSDDFFFLF